MSARFQDNFAWSFLNISGFLLFPRQTADVCLEVRLRRGWLQYRSREFFVNEYESGYLTTGLVSSTPFSQALA